MVKVLSWNVNGLGMVAKRNWVKRFVKENRISFLCLQETKLSINQNWGVGSIWGSKQVDFVTLDAVGMSSGILTAWDRSSFIPTKSDKQEGFVAVLGVWLSNKSAL